MAAPWYTYDEMFPTKSGLGAAPAATDTDIMAQKWLRDKAFAREMALKNASLGAGTTPAAPTVAPAAAAAPPPSGVMGRMAATVPTLGQGWGAVKNVGGVLKRLIPGVGAAVGVGAEASGVADVVNDPATSKIDVATRIAEGAGRLGAMGAGAGVGFAAGGPIGAALGGTAGYFAPEAIYAARDWIRGGTTPVSPVNSAAVPVAGPENLFDAGAMVGRNSSGANVGFGAPPATLAAAVPAVTPFTAADIRGNRVPVSGTGAFMNSAGEVTNIGTPTPAMTGTVMPRGFGMAPAMTSRPGPTGTPKLNGSTPVSRFFGASMGIKNISGDNTLRMAAEELDQKAAASAAQVGATMEGHRLAEQTRRDALAAKANDPAHVKAALESAMLYERLGLNPDSPRDVARGALIGGHALPAPTPLQVPLNMQPLPGAADQSVPVFDPRTGAIRKVLPSPVARTTTMVELQTAAKRAGKSIEEAVANAQRDGVQIVR